GEQGRVLPTRSHDAEYSPDGRFIVVAAGDTATIWDTETGEQVRVLNGHRAAVFSAVYSPDGHFIVTASQDGSAIVWDAETGEQVRVLSGHTKSVSSAEYSPDGRFIVTASEDGTAIIWDADYHEFIAYACEQLASLRDFYSDERENFGIDDTPTCPQFA